MSIPQRQIDSNHSVVLDQTQQDYIFSSIMDNKSIDEICRDLKIPKHHIYDYAFKDPFFAKRLEQVRTYQTHSLVDSLRKVTDDCHTLVDVGLARVKSDNIKWTASKIVPQVYGERIDLNMNHSLDLSSVLLAAENRVLPILEARKAIQTTSTPLPDLLPDHKEVAVEDFKEVEISEKLEDLF